MTPDAALDEIIKEIKKGLTGEEEKDIAFLKECAEKYIDTEYGEDIADACAKMIYNRLPDDLKEEFSEMARRERLGIAECNDRAKALLLGKKPKEARVILEEMIDRLEKSGRYKASDGIEYFDFRQPMEEALFREAYGMDKKIRIVPEPVSGLYRLYAESLYEMGEYEKSMESSNKALLWNPYKASAALEYAHCLRALGRMDEYKKYVDDIFKIAWIPEKLAGAFRCLAYYYADREEWEAAAVCDNLGRYYNPESDIARKERLYIDEHLPEGWSTPDGDRLKDLAKQYGFPLNPDEYLVRLAHSAGEAFKNAGSTEMAEYFFGVEKDLKRN